MRATLPQGAPSTYYGQWNARILRQHRQIDRSIAHSELGASAKFAGVEVCGRVLPGNRGSSPREIYTGPKKKFRTSQTSEQRAALRRAPASVALRRWEQGDLAGLEQQADILALDQPAQDRARFVQQPELVAELVEVADPAAHREDAAIGEVLVGRLEVLRESGRNPLLRRQALEALHDRLVEAHHLDGLDLD